MGPHLPEQVCFSKEGRSSTTRKSAAAPRTNPEHPPHHAQHDLLCRASLGSIPDLSGILFYLSFFSQENSQNKRHQKTNKENTISKVPAAKSSSIRVDG